MPAAAAPARTPLAELPLALFLPSLFPTPSSTHPGALKQLPPSASKPSPTLKRPLDVSPSKPSPAKRRLLSADREAGVGRRLFVDVPSSDTVTATPLPSPTKLAPSPEIAPRSSPFTPVHEEDKENVPPRRRHRTAPAPSVLKGTPATKAAECMSTPRDRRAVGRLEMMREVDERVAAGDDEDDDQVEGEI